LPGNLPHRVYATEFAVRGIAWDNKKLASVTIGSTSLALAPLAPTDTFAIPVGAVAGVFTTTIRLDSVGVNEATITAVDATGLTSSTVVRIDRIAPADAVEVLAPLTNAEVEGVSTVLQFRPWFEVATYSISVNLIEVIRGQRPKNKRPGDVISDEIPLVVGYNQVQLTLTGVKGERMNRTIGVSRKYTQTVVQAPVAALKKRTATSGPQQWAVVIGVSEYRHLGIPSLKYADKDAEAFANFLRTSEGGGYDNEHMRVLLNKDATLPNVREALIDFLSNAIDMDLVVIYFAGHGAPEPARPQNLYLLTHDSDPTKLGTSAFPMWQIQDVLGRYINAKRIIVFSDACHSGGISVNFATRGVGATEQNLVNQYLADLSRSKEGTVVFTASAAGEVSQEFPEFGHGVFTQYLLEGLRGKADYNNDYTITINEAMQYTEEQVKRKTRGAQNPTRSQTAYDKEMTVALIPH
ncbi:MAG: caspase family protein, partial [Bacteroidota bacterium]